MSTPVSNSELGAFLRGRREALSAAEAGLPTGSRRRTPGLRRAELATLAGVSVDYLTRLEQGRDRHPSAEILGALADALRLSAPERIHLRMLAKVTGGPACRGMAVEAPNRTVRPTVRALLDRLEPAPAYVVNRLGDVLACTTGYRRLAAPLGLLDGERPNLARFVFTDPRARAAYPEWERVAGELVAALPVAARHSDPYLADLVDELTVAAGAAFTDRLASAEPARRAGVERLAHPGVGELRLAYEMLELPDADDQRLVVYLPADDASSAALDRLSGLRPGGLRAVPGRSAGTRSA
ncbi:helix-turn-helix domain-containing protein [Actinoplanes sp. ATCC 53533]|uniref:helix-turn-helix domain-containing protein n=1 Tax=Actinoplanes sp. ATCC 53533 TaxID=1288362 RepID=UPI001F3E518F|nr:helix-turn-helix transcriptional regulator [Actinoplanes sp. ATCC 53533]